MRSSTRINKEQFTSAKYKTIPNAKPAAKPKRAAKPKPAANIAIPAVNVNNPIADEINEKIEMFMSEETPYWRATFYTPNDYITDKYFEVVEYYEKLPASLQLGLGNSEVIEPEPIKHTPLLSKLITGDYHKAQSKSDENIATSIKFFSMPSFKQYKGQDELDWVVQH
jgi:hypothetical protein